MQGSGKSLITGMFLQSLLGRNQTQRPRVIVNNQKDDIIPVMYSYGYTFESGNLRYLNLLDERSSRWNIADDIKDAVAVREVIEELIDEKDDGKEKYWDDWARDLAEGVMTSFLQRYPSTWTFSQFISFIDLPIARIVEILQWSSDNACLVDKLNDLLKYNPKQLLQVTHSVVQRLRRYKLVAALSERTTSSISATEFVRENYAVVMRVPPEARETISTYNRIFIRQVAKHFLLQPTKESGGQMVDRTYIILDEFAGLGKIEELPELLDQGRDRGLSVLIAFHDIDQVIKHYRDDAKSLLARFGNIAILRTTHVDTQLWASSFFGSKVELVVIEGRSNQVSAQSINSRTTSPIETWSNSRSIQGTIMENPVVRPSDFRVPATRVSNAINGYFMTFVGGCRYGIPIEYALNNLERGDLAIPAYLPYDLSQISLNTGREVWAAIFDNV
jgi:type IV secretory pathway TraG/TraD family ATPase VirD4